MKLVERFAAQGDVFFLRVEKIPEGFTKQEAKGDIVVAHSETGHHHTVPGLDAVLFAKRGEAMVSYLQMNDEKALEVTHHRSFDKHKPFALLGKGGTVWEVRRQKEHTPEGLERRVED